MIIAFLSTDLLILNRDPRMDNVKKMIIIIQNIIKQMNSQNIPRILKNIYIQITKKPKKTINELLESYNYDKKLFQGINFDYIFLPSISEDELSEINHDLMKLPKYKDNFIKILERLINSNLLKNSVSSLIDYIDIFNETINGNGGYNSQTIFKDLELDFNGVYSRYETKLKNELSQRIDSLIQLQNSKESFEQFIGKQKNLKFTFEIKNDDFTFYGSCDNFNSFYEKLKKGKNFRIDPAEIFFGIYETQKTKLEIEEKKKELKRREEELRRKREEDKKREEEEEKRLAKEREEKRKLYEKMEKERDEQKKREIEERRRREEEIENRKRELEKQRRLEKQKKEDEEQRRKMEEQKRKFEEEEKINNL